MVSNEFIILLFNRMAAAPAFVPGPVHLVPVFLQDEVLPDVWGEVRQTGPYTVSMTPEHYRLRSPLIRAKIRELYQLEDGDDIRINPGNVYDNLIKYEIFHRFDPGAGEAVVRPKKPVGEVMARNLLARLNALGPPHPAVQRWPPPRGGKRRSTRKTKRRPTRKLKRKRVYYSTG